jgi:hypothetical protein
MICAHQRGRAGTMKRYVTASIVVSLASAFALGSTAGASIGDKSKPKETKAERSLIDDHVPPATASTCKGKTADEKKYLAKSFPSQKSKVNKIVAAVECFPTSQGSPDEVDYVQMASLNGLLGLYQANLDFYNIQSQASAAATRSGLDGPTATTCPAEFSYGPTGAAAKGRVLCHPSSSSSQGDLVWTNEPLKIYSEAFLKTDPTGSLLRSFFGSVDSGPEG